MIINFKVMTPILTAIVLLASVQASFSHPHQAIETKNSSEESETLSTQVNSSPLTNLAETDTQPSLNFTCDTSQNLPMTMAHFTQGEIEQSVPFLQWTGGPFSLTNVAEDFCNNVSAKLQQYYQNNDADFEFSTLIVEEIDEIPVVCIEAILDQGCTPDGVLFSLEGVDNPQKILTQMIADQLPEPPTRGDFRLPLGVLFPW